MKRWILTFVITSLALLALVYLLLWIFGGLEGLDFGFHSILALVLGTTLTAALGVGLMALVFYSNRSGQDDSANDAGR